MSETTNARLIFNAVPKAYPIPGETTVVDKSQKLDLENVALNGGFLVQLVASRVSFLVNRALNEKYYNVKLMLRAASIDGLGVGKVLRSENAKVKIGDILYGNYPYQEYYIGDSSKVDNFRVLDKSVGLPLQSYTGSAGMPGKTAFYGWKEHIEPKAKKGDTIFISTAAGPVGSFLAQIAKRAGLKVIGSTGSDDKVAFLKSIGVDVAFNYKTEDMRSVLQKEGPIQFYFDHVGGDTLDAALENMAPEGKVIVCGQIASYNGTPVPVKNFPLILTKRLTVIGHMVGVYESKYADEFYRVIPREIAEGKIKIVEHEYQGLDEAGQALLDVQKGDNKGKAVVILSKA